MPSFNLCHLGDLRPFPWGEGRGARSFAALGGDDKRKNV